MLKKHGAKKWLSDDRDNVLIPEDDMAWSDTVWSPRVVKAGWTFLAVVVPTQAVGALQLLRLVSEYKNRGVTAKIFDSIAKGKKWQEEQEEQEEQEA